MKTQTIQTKGAEMKRLLTLIATLGVAAWGTDVANANLLSNPNLDTISVGPQQLATPTGWAVSSSKTISGTNSDGCSAETFANVCCGNPAYGLFFKAFQGSQPSGDYINVLFFQDSPAIPGGKYTLSGYAAAEANYCGRFNTNSPAPQSLFVVQFLNSGGTVLASNVYDLAAAGLPVGVGAVASQFTTPQFTAPAGTATVRAGASMLNGYNTSGGQAFIVDAFDLEVQVPQGAPVITNQPTDLTVAVGSAAHFTVGVSNPPVSYQWQFNETNISNGGHFSGVTTATLTVSPASFADVGHYRVLVSNGGGSVFSSEAALTVGANEPAVIINGQINDTYRVDYSAALAPQTWIPLSTNVLTNVQQQIIDPSTPQPNNRFYRAIFLR
jgi:hypothetical protein